MTDPGTTAQRRGRRRAALVSSLLLVAWPALAGDDLAARVKAAQEAVRANTATATGREWMKRNSPATDRLMIELLNKCLPDPPGDIPTVFSVYVRLAQAGRAREIVTELDAELGSCMTKAAQEVTFPQAPRDDYWIQVNMAAPL
jgi:hypothetical protein